MSTLSEASLSLFAFAITSSLYVGYRNIEKQLRNLKADVVQCNRRDFSRKLELSENIPTNKIDLLLEMHSVISHENVEGKL